MVPGDDNGLVLPPEIAPIQLVIIPIAAHKPGVTEKAKELEARLRRVCRVKTDNTDNSPGWKFAEHEMKGVPLRLEIGPRDIENNRCVLVRRDNREKTEVSLDSLEDVVLQLLKTEQQALFDAALARREKMTFTCTDLDTLIDTAANHPGFIKAMWCGDEVCENKLKEVAGVSSRCMPFEQEHLADTCVCCGKPANHMVYWGKAY
jgi:prolyl-tRNA synthetase